MISDKLRVTEHVDVIIVVFEILEIVLGAVIRRIFDFLETYVYVFESYRQFRDFVGKSFVGF
jgi:hypothetical protein